MITANAVITDVIVEKTNVWIQFDIEGKCFPAHYEFDSALLKDVTKLLFLIERTHAKNINDLVGKNIRVIDTEETINSVVAVGDSSKNKFVDLYGSEYTVREKRIYRRYRKHR